MRTLRVARWSWGMAMGAQAWRCFAIRCSRTEQLARPAPAYHLAYWGEGMRMRGSWACCAGKGGGGSGGWDGRRHCYGGCGGRAERKQRCGR